MTRERKRWIARQLRKLVDLLDDRLHAWEVSLRTPPKEIAMPPSTRLGGLAILRAGSVPGQAAARACALRSETFQQWEARRSGVAVITKKEARRRRAVTAAQFDARFQCS